MKKDVMKLILGLLKLIGLAAFLVALIVWGFK